ncbi:MAG: hypothetical protein RL235_1200 [Chlamydiota bacterium]
MRIFKYAYLISFAFIIGCKKQQVKDYNEEQVEDETLILRPADLGCSKYVFPVDVKSDEFAILTYKYPTVIPVGMYSDNIPLNKWIKLKSSKSGKVIFSMTMMNSQYFNIISRSIQRDSKLPVHALNIDGDDSVVVPNSVVKAMSQDDNNFNISLAELNPDLSIKRVYNIECDISVIKKNDALRLYPSATKGYSTNSSEWVGLQNVNEDDP